MPKSRAGLLQVSINVNGRPSWFSCLNTQIGHLRPKRHRDLHSIPSVGNYGLLPCYPKKNGVTRGCRSYSQGFTVHTCSEVKHEKRESTLQTRSGPRPRLINGFPFKWPSPVRNLNTQARTQTHQNERTQGDRSSVRARRSASSRTRNPPKSEHQSRRVNQRLGTGTGHERFYLNLDKFPGSDEKILRDLISATNISAEVSKHSSIEDELGLPKSFLADEYQQRRKNHQNAKPRLRDAELTEQERKTQNNPYAQILASPLRFDQTSGSRLPRDLLLPFTLVRDNDTGNMWQTSCEMLWPKPLSRPLKPPKVYIAKIQVEEIVAHVKELEVDEDEHISRPVDEERHDLDAIRKQVADVLLDKEVVLVGDLDQESKNEDARQVALMLEGEADPQSIHFHQEDPENNLGTPLLCYNPDPDERKAFDDFRAGIYKPAPTNYIMSYEARFNVPAFRASLENLVRTSIKRVRELPTLHWETALKQEIAGRDRALERLFRLDMFDLVVRQARHEALVEFKKVMKNRNEIIVPFDEHEMAAGNEAVFREGEFCALLSMQDATKARPSRDTLPDASLTFNLRQLFLEKEISELNLPEPSTRGFLGVKTHKGAVKLIKRLYRLMAIVAK